jgi:hypothetical protein
VLKRVAGTFVLAILGLLIALVLGELAVRGWYGEKFGKRPGFFIGDDRLGWKPAPELEHMFFGPDYSIRVATDADGYRLGALGGVGFDEKLVVLCGDSFTFGWGVSTGETFASYLDELLYDASGGSIRAVNLGVGGYGTFQHCDRLQGLLANHPNAGIHSVIVIHAQNDATDNLRNLGYHLGQWTSETKIKERSWSHLINLLGYARLRFAGREAATTLEAAGDDYLQDMLFAYEPTKKTLIPRVIEVGGETVKLHDLSLADFDAAETLRRKALSRVQQEMMVLALKCIHKALEEHNTPIIHAFIYTNEDWYVEAVGKLIERSLWTRDDRVVNVGRIPKKGEYAKRVNTGHSGGHYNAEFNRYWARRVFDVLAEYTAIRNDVSEESNGRSPRRDGGGPEGR